MDWKCDYTNTRGSERIGLQYVDGTLDNWSIFLWVPITISQPWLKRCLAIAKKYLTKWVPFICHGWIVCWWLKSMFVFKLWLFCFYPDHHNVFFFKYRFFKPTFYILFTLSLSIINARIYMYFNQVLYMFTYFTLSPNSPRLMLSLCNLPDTK